MKNESLIILFGTLGFLLLSFIVLLLKFLWEVVHEDRWIKSLGKEQLLQLEDQLENCLQAAKISSKDDVSIDAMIEQQGFSIQEKQLMLLREAYTTKRPVKEVYIRKSLPSNRRHFALAHELMHIIYKQEELDIHPLSRDIHLLFRSRDESEQIRDYMAAGLILQKDIFWNELMDVHYFNITPLERKDFVYKSAQKYNVEPSMVFRRISELNVIMQQEF